LFLAEVVSQIRNNIVELYIISDLDQLFMSLDITKVFLKFMQRDREPNDYD
jgi:hypothetical protein